MTRDHREPLNKESSAIDQLGRVRYLSSRVHLPYPLPTNEVLVIGTRSKPRWIVFACPCGSGHDIQLNSDPRRWPRWRLTRSLSGRPSIYPSVDAQGATRCHFWVRSGRVHWVPSVGDAPASGEAKRRRLRMRRRGG